MARKKRRATTGLSDHGGKIHVYFRDIPKTLCVDDAKAVFKKAADMLVHIISEVLPPPAVVLSDITPPPPQPELVFTSPSSATMSDNAYLPLQPELDYIAVYDFDGSEYGPQCLRIAVGDRGTLIHRPASLEAVGWAYVRAGKAVGWVPSNYMLPAIEEF